MYARHVALDAELLRQAKAAEAGLIDAEHAAEVARSDFHRAVRRLQLAGGSLREIADALGLSHQRVHQIVEGAGGSRSWRKSRIPPADLLRCSSCGKTQKQVKKLIAGPGVYICGECVDRVNQLLGNGVESARGAHRVSAEAAAERCSFCGKRRHQVAAMAAAGTLRICSECLQLCNEIIEEELA
jgi:hypothetical protein